MMPGPDLDRLIAERIFERETKQLPCHRSMETGEWETNVPGREGSSDLRWCQRIQYRDRLGDVDNWIDFEPIPAYSESIAAAFEVVQAMIVKGWLFVLVALRVSSVLCWEATFDDTEHPAKKRLAESAPHAIVMAALDVVAALEEK